MGGTIRVILREEDGTTHKMNRWTNSLPGFVNTLGFINKDKGHLNDYMEAYLDMKKDWEKNHESGNFELNMTDCYFPESEYIGPDDYGLVLFDQVNNKILSLQGYTQLGRVYAGALVSLFKEDKGLVGVRGGAIDADDEKEALELYHAGKLKTYQKWNRDTYEHEILEFTEDLIKEELQDRDNNLNYVLIDLSPWELIDFDENLEGIRALKEAVKELGFELTEEDEKGWAGFESQYS